MKKTNYEIQMIARILADQKEYYNNSNMLHEALFIRHGEIYNYVISQIHAGRIPTHESLMANFGAQQDIILDIITGLDYSVPLELVIQELHENYRNYTINSGMTKAGMAISSDEKVNILTETLTQLEKYEVKQEVFHIYDVAKEVILKLESGVEQGLKTGFAAFDGHTGGLQPSDLIVVGARSSQGKTSLALTMSANLSQAGYKSLFISMELSKPQLTLRHLSGMINISPKSAVHNLVPFKHAANLTRETQFYLADVNNTSYRNIIGIIRSAKIRLDIDVVFIDYLQLMRSDQHGNKREQEVGTIARAFKNLAKELDMPIVLLSQLSRDDGKNPEPRLDSLRDSGQIEEAADIVWLIYRPEFYNIEEYTYYLSGSAITKRTSGRAFHIIAKGRNYGTTTFETGFNSKVARFTETGFIEAPEAGEPQGSNANNSIKSAIHTGNDDSGETLPF